MPSKSKKELNIPAGRPKSLSDEVRDNILYLHEKNVDKEFIAKMWGISISTVNATIYVNQAIIEDRFDDAIRYASMGKNTEIMNWALKRNGKELPKEEPKEAEEKGLTPDQLTLTALSLPPVEPLKFEEQKKEPAIDPGRIMYALGKIDERLETLCDLANRIMQMFSGTPGNVSFISKDLEEMHKHMNANADEIRSSIQDTKGAVVQAIKKIPKTYRGE